MYTYQSTRTDHASVPVWYCMPRQCFSATLVLHAQIVLQCHNGTACPDSATVPLWYCMPGQCYSATTYCMPGQCCSATMVLHAQTVLQCQCGDAWQHNAAVPLWYCSSGQCYSATNGMQCHGALHLREHSCVLLWEVSKQWPTCGSWEAHIGGLHRGWQQSKDLIAGAFSVSIQVDGDLDLIRADLACNVSYRPG